MDIALMLYRLGEDQRYIQIVQFLRMESNITRARIRDVIVNVERGMTGNWAQVPQQRRQCQLTGAGLAAVVDGVSGALRNRFSHRWCASYILGKCAGATCPNGRPEPFVHPASITPAMKAFAKEFVAWKVAGGGARERRGRRNNDRRSRGSDR